MTRPKIGMVLNTMGLGGVPEVAYQLMRHLSRARFELALCVLKHDVSTAAAARAAREARFAALDVPVYYAAASSAKLDAIAAVGKWITESRIDLLHTHSYRPNVYARLAGMVCRPRGLRIVAHYHNQYADKWDREPLMLTFEQQLAAGTDAMIAVSASVRSHVATCLGVDASRIDVVSNAVDVAAFDGGDRVAARAALGVDGDQPVLGLIGRVCRQKGQDTFVDAALRLVGRHPEAVFLMAGDLEDSALHQALAARVAEAGHTDSIRFLGHRTDIAAVYAGLDVVVAPSRWEGFGLMLVEAMAAGKPIVASRAGAIPDIVREGETGTLVPADDVAALADAIDGLLASPARRRAFAAAGPAAAAAFSWPVAAGQLADVYDRVIDGARQGR